VLNSTHTRLWKRKIFYRNRPLLLRVYVQVCVCVCERVWFDHMEDKPATGQMFAVDPYVQELRAKCCLLADGLNQRQRMMLSSMWAPGEKGHFCIEAILASTTDASLLRQYHCEIEMLFAQKSENDARLLKEEEEIARLRARCYQLLEQLHDDHASSMIISLLDTCRGYAGRAHSNEPERVFKDLGYAEHPFVLRKCIMNLEALAAVHVPPMLHAPVELSEQ